MATRVGASVPVYCLSDGAQMPDFVTERKRRQMQKEDEGLRRRIELLQDFEYSGGTSKRAKFSEDGRFLVTTGEYPPRCKMFELGQLGMKYERHLGCDCVDVLGLSEDLGKMVFLLADRTIDVHAPYGSHYRMRVPSHGRELAYDASRCLLHVAGAKADVHRLDLSRGQMIEPIVIGDASKKRKSSVGINRMKMAPPGLPLIATGSDDGVVRLWDGRGDPSTPASSVDVRDDEEEVTALAWDPSGIKLAVGTSGARVKVYDIRMRAPLVVKEHQYELPIVDCHFYRPSHAASANKQVILSADERLVKAWNVGDGSTVLNVETPARLSQLEVSPTDTKASGDSGLIVCPGEQPRIMTYFMPTLGPAPKWCAYLENITEELEESKSSAFEDFRFVTAKDVEELGASNLIGTPMLKAYMHGFFIDIKLYRKLKAVAEPFAYDNWRKEVRQKKIDAKLEDKIRRVVQQKKPKSELPPVNADLAQRLMETDSKVLGDDRFGAMFQNLDFEIDVDSPEYLLRHPNAKRGSVATGAADPSAARRLAPRVLPNEQSETERQEREASAPAPQPKKSVRVTKSLDPASALGLGEVDNSFARQDETALSKRLKKSGGDSSSEARTTRQAGVGLVKEFKYVPKKSTKANEKKAAGDPTSIAAKKKKMMGQRKKGRR